MTKIIGLTGGIGSGKTTVAKYFASKGIPVYIADDAAKNIMNDKKVVQEIQSIFSENVIQENGLLNRNLIRKLVFNDKYKLDQLNNIVHPYHAKNIRVKAIIFLVFNSLFNINGLINPINIQKSNVVIVISIFCKFDK